MAAMGQQSATELEGRVGGLVAQPSRARAWQLTGRGSSTGACAAGDCTARRLRC